MPILRTLLFVTIMTLALCGLHYYLYLRIARGLSLGPAEQRLLKLGLGALFALLWLSFPLMRLVPRPIASPILWASYIWMGTMAVSAVTFGLVDLARLLGGALSPLLPIDESRRVWLGKLVDVLALGGAAAMSATALTQGLRKVGVKRVEISLAKLPPSLDGFRMVQLTDVHIGPTLDGRWLREVVSKVNALQADVVVITGDLVDGSVAQLLSHVEPLRELQGTPAGDGLPAGPRDKSASGAARGSNTRPWKPSRAAKSCSAATSVAVNAPRLIIVDAQSRPRNTTICDAGSSTPSCDSAVNAMFASRRVSRGLRDPVTRKRE